MCNIFEHLESCILSFISKLVNGAEYGSNGDVNERLIRAYYDIYGDNIRHALDDLAIRIAKDQSQPREDDDG